VGQGDVRELGTGLREQRLVGADHRAPPTQCRFDQRAGRLDPPDQLDHDVDVVALDQAAGIAGDQVVREEGLL